MGEKVSRIRVFLSSPGDVAEARSIVREIVERQIQKERAFRNTKLEVISWDDPHAPVPLDAYLTPQQAIDRDLTRPSACDVVVVLLWSRMGTPLTHDGQSYLSGTHYEYLDAVGAQRKPRVLVFRCTAPPEDAWATFIFDETPDEQRNQLASVERFFSSFSGADGSARGSYISYRSVGEFRDLASRLFRDVLQERIEHSRADPTGDLGIALSFRRKLADFCDEYLVSESGRVPFAGRDGELERLDNWLRGDTRHPRLLITAPAGRGKSALIVQWLERLASIDSVRSADWKIAFMPISIRVGTNRPEEFYKGLALRLAEISGLPLDETEQRDANYFRASVRKQLDNIAERGLRVLVVIDGIDEALEGTFVATLAPKVLPKTLRILFSARWQVGDSDSSGWLQRLGWGHDTRVETMELQKLDAAHITEVLLRLGVPTDDLARSPGLVKQLFELTDGEPLLVRYYAADLWDQTLAGARITAADLSTLKPGFGNYFQRWLDHQEVLWRAEGASVDVHQVDRVLVVLAHAYGPLTEADLLALYCEVHGGTAPDFADRLLRPLRRFVMGKGRSNSGYVLSHPRVGEYLRAERFHSVELKVLRAFAAWGSRHVSALNSRTIASHSASHYLLLYLPRHLAVAGAPASEFMMLVDDGWRRAWETWEGGHRGFANAVEIAWQSCQKDGPVAHLGWQWRCALTLASIRSLGSQIPTPLLFASVLDGLLTAPQARYYAELKGYPEAVIALLHLALATSECSEKATELAVAALDVAMMATSSQSAEHIAAALNLLDQFRKVSDFPLLDVTWREVLEAAIERSRRLEGYYPKARALSMISLLIDGTKRDELINEAKEYAEAIGPEQERAQAWIFLISVVDPAERPAIAVLAYQEAKEVEDATSRSWALLHIAQSADESLKQKAIQGSLEAALTIEDEQSRSKALSSLSACLNSEQLQTVLSQQHEIREPRYRLILLTAVAPCVKGTTLDQVLQAAKGLEDPLSRSEAIAAIVPHLETCQRLEVLQQALDAALEINDTNRFKALAALAPHLDCDQRKSILADAVATAARIKEEYARSLALSDLAPHLDANLLDAALEVASAIGDAEKRCSALLALAPRCAPNRRQEVVTSALDAALSIGETVLRHVALRDVAPLLGDPAQTKRALAGSMGIGDYSAACHALTSISKQVEIGERKAVQIEALRAGAAAIRGGEFNACMFSEELTDLVPHLGNEELNLALQIANSIEWDVARIHALVQLAPYLESSKCQVIIAKAFTEATAISHTPFRASTLVELAPYLDPAQLQQAVNLIASTVGQKDRCESLTGILRYLHEPRREQFIAEVFQTAVGIKEEHERASVIKSLAPYLSRLQRRSVLEVAPELNEYNRSIVLIALAPHLDDKQVLDALAAAEDLPHELRANTLLALALNQNISNMQTMLMRALEEARAIPNAWGRASVLTEIAHRLEPTARAEAVAEAMDAALTIDDRAYRSRALSALLPLVESAEEGKRASAKALAAANGSFNDLVNLIDVVDDGAVLMTSLLDATRGMQRSAVLFNSSELFPLLVSIGGASALDQFRRAVVDLYEWYP